MNNKIYVKGWISLEEAEENDYKESIGGMGGFFENGMRGQKDFFDNVKEEVKPYYDALRKNIISNNIKCTGEQHQYENYVPLFSDNTIGSFSFRAWGDLMAAIWSEEENKNYSYMDFYC